MIEKPTRKMNDKNPYLNFMNNSALSQLKTKDDQNNNVGKVRYSSPVKSDISRLGQVESAQNLSMSD